MARRYLLDTNVLSDLVRQPQGAVARRIARIGEAQVCTSIIVAGELRYGATRSGSAKLMRQVAAVLGAMDVLPFEADADLHYAAIRHALESRGMAIGANDLLIAAHARAIDAVCVTGNVAEFRRVAGLRVENWR
ncbi:MAG: type II toxin-antitoxin system VapC family toxin [Gammaproteobacteria bacterium]|nr:type II toxin-antitoxin system VapC family toxin [Gammaproteobacteria bacterium]QOJ32398.1 MAG: type II toxin-antitoxin system VapC family toxin [Gammaproteobacteria bacterium]